MPREPRCPETRANSVSLQQRPIATVFFAPRPHASHALLLPCPLLLCSPSLLTPPRVPSSPVPPPHAPRDTFPHRKPPAPAPHLTSASLSTRPSCITPTAFRSLALSRASSADTCGTGTGTKRAWVDEPLSLSSRRVDYPCCDDRPRSEWRTAAAPAAARPLIRHVSTDSVGPVKRAPTAQPDASSQPAAPPRARHARQPTCYPRPPAQVSTPIIPLAEPHLARLPGHCLPTLVPHPSPFGVGGCGTSTGLPVIRYAIRCTAHQRPLPRGCQAVPATRHPVLWVPATDTNRPALPPVRLLAPQLPPAVPSPTCPTLHPS